MRVREERAWGADLHGASSGFMLVVGWGPQGILVEPFAIIAMRDATKWASGILPHGNRSCMSACVFLQARIALACCSGHMLTYANLQLVLSLQTGFNEQECSSSTSAARGGFRAFCKRTDLLSHDAMRGCWCERCVLERQCMCTDRARRKALVSRMGRLRHLGRCMMVLHCRVCSELSIFELGWARLYAARLRWHLRQGPWSAAGRTNGDGCWWHVCRDLRARAMHALSHVLSCKRKPRCGCQA